MGVAAIHYYYYYYCATEAKSDIFSLIIVDYNCCTLLLELSVGLQTEGVDVRSVGNSQVQ